MGWWKKGDNADDEQDRMRVGKRCEGMIIVNRGFVIGAGELVKDDNSDYQPFADDMFQRFPVAPCSR